MRGKLITFNFLVVLLTFFISGANAADMVPEYLVGNWVIGTTEQKCGDSDSEYFMFHENGIFEAGRSSRPEAVGFWQIDGDMVNLDFISSGGFFQQMFTSRKGTGSSHNLWKLRQFSSFH